MATVVSTMQDESIEDFLKALGVAVEKYLMAKFPSPENGGSERLWGCVKESTRGDYVVAEAMFDREEKYLKVPYTRDPESGEFVFGEPEPVREVTQFVPEGEEVSPILEGPPDGPMGLSVVVALEALPVSVPAPEGALTPGKPVQLLREGAIFNVLNGKFLKNVTQALCSEIAESAQKMQMPIPIDFGHALLNAQIEGKDHSNIPLFGRMSALEARPGSGLWGLPEWTDKGMELLSANPGVLYLSPTLLPPPFDPSTGEALPGNWLHSVSLTPNPKQNNLAPVALSVTPEPEVAPVEPVPVQEVAVDAINTLSEKDSEIAGLKLSYAELAEKFAAIESERVQLSLELEALRAEKNQRDFEALFDLHSKRGVVLSQNLKDEFVGIGLTKASAILDKMIGERPVALGHGGAPVGGLEPESQLDRDLKIIGIAKSKNISLNKAAQELAK